MISADALIVAGAIFVTGIAIFWMWVIRENRIKASNTVVLNKEEDY